VAGSLRHHRGVTHTPSDHRLLLLRHAKAASPAGVPDHDRPLAERGLADAAAVGRWLASAGGVDLVLRSDAWRAVQTWDAAAAALATSDVGAPMVRDEPRLYAASVDEVLAVLADVDEGVRTVLVVGHEPTTSAVASVLASEESDVAAVARVRAGLPTSGVAVLRTGRAWADLTTGCAVLEEVATPRD
jgi:phosphohistidine phosphatase